jgi:hypothetical protein
MAQTAESALAMNLYVDIQALLLGGRERIGVYISAEPHFS